MTHSNEFSDDAEARSGVVEASAEQDAGTTQKLLRPSRGAFALTGCLLELTGETPGRRLDLGAEALTFGRDSTCEVVIDRPEISRRHAVFEVHAQGLTVRDLGSTNGTWVNDAPVQQTRLLTGDRVRIGASVFRVIIGDELEAEVRQQRRRLTRLDGATQVLHRAAFLRALLAQLAQVGRASVIAIGVADAQAMHRRLGAEPFERLMALLADQLRLQVRSVDSLGRAATGVLVLLAGPLTDDRARDVGARLRRRVERARFLLDGELLPLKLVIGVAATKAPPRPGQEESTVDISVSDSVDGTWPNAAMPDESAEPDLITRAVSELPDSTLFVD